MTTPMKLMKNQQSGFTLVEIAIVLVIIGLLLGGILKGQELINSAKVKNLAQDFKTIPLYIYGYQDRFKALPGDDPRVVTNVPGATLAAGTVGNGVIDGSWNSTAVTEESALFWQHVRLANFAPGPTSTTDANYFPTNVDSGRMGIQSGATSPIIGLRGTYIFCSSGILGKFASQLDTTLDDGNTATGSIMAANIPTGSTAPAAPETNQGATPTLNVASSYTVCMGF